jgi:hypothetical protein
MGILTSPRPPRISFFSLIALLYSQILVLMVIPGVVVFHYAWRYDHHSQGLYVAVGLSPMLKNLMCGESWTVRIDSRENWYLNSTKTSQNELAGVLSQRLGDKSNCAVYLDVDPSLPYAVAVEAVATIQKTRAKVAVLLTPKTKKSPPPKNSSFAAPLFHTCPGSAFTRPYAVPDSMCGRRRDGTLCLGVPRMRTGSSDFIDASALPDEDSPVDWLNLPPSASTASL